MASTTSLGWREAGLTAHQAAAHLLDRFAYGARPGEVERVADLGPESWVGRQLAAGQPEAQLERRTRALTAWRLSAAELAERYPPTFAVLYAAERAGVVPGTALEPDLPETERGQLRRAVYDWAERQGIRPERELVEHLMSHKLLAAIYAENQLLEVLTDFWFNHFNVALQDNQARPHLLAYERDAIRPNVLGSFRALLEATARHPAMLLYLDNAQSTANEGAPTTLDDDLRRLRAGRVGRAGRAFGRRGGRETEGADRRRRRSTGLNENYARELLELHTLGVDGGYTQQDVIEVARAFTGWSVVPPRALMDRGDPDGEIAGGFRRLEMARRLGARFEVDGQFLFRADAHDAGRKSVLGGTLPAGRGIEDGRDVLDVLAAHASTARFVATKLAARFVADEPPPLLVERLAATWRATRGDLRALVAAIATSPEFWAEAPRRSKIKSPFELAVSALRALDADVARPRETVEWIERMGQLPYGYQAPTGYPDRAAAWVNGGALLNRMNFGLQLAAGRVDGVTVDLWTLDGGREPESPEQALAVYAASLLPGRDPAETTRLLTPALRDPRFTERVVAAAPEPAVAPPEPTRQTRPTMRPGREERTAADRIYGPVFGRERFVERRMRRPEDSAPPSTAQQVVGLLLGSPEFQRR